MEQFVVLFHLFAVFNFAYVLSDGFNQELNDRIVNAFEVVKKLLSDIESEITGTRTSLLTLKAVKEGHIDTSGKMQELREAIAKFDTDYKEFKTKDILPKIQAAGLTKGFVYICLYCGLYCLLILFFWGLKTKINPFPKETLELLYIFDIFSTLFIVYCLYHEKKDFIIAKYKALDKLSWWQTQKIKVINKLYKNKISYLRTLAFLFISLAISIVIELLDYHILKHKHWTYDKLSLVLQLWGIGIASFHFIYYFIRTILNSIQLSAKLLSLVQAKADFFKQNVTDELNKLKNYGEQTNEYVISNNYHPTAPEES